MASGPIATARFPGIENVTDCTYTLTHGISPGVIQLRITPQPGIATEVGSVVIDYDAFRLTLPDCKIDRASFQRSESGEIWSLSIFDRRWRWEFGEISGRYNVPLDNESRVPQEPDPSNRIERATEKTPRELLNLCLDAMGEKGYDTSKVSNLARPFVEWDVATPAQALASLCDDLGCRVVMKADGHVEIEPQGIGIQLPDGPTAEDGGSIDSVNLPSRMRVVTAPVRWQVTLELEAVGIDSDASQTIKDIDLLSYLPVEISGWEYSDPPEFMNVYDEHGKLARERAAASVYRMYRIKADFTVPDVPGIGTAKIKDLSRILPLIGQQIDASEDELGKQRPAPPAVFGVWWDGRANYENSADEFGDEPDEDNEWRASFNVDEALGIIVFDRPVYKLEESDVSGEEGYLIKPADLKIKLTINIRDEDTHAWIRAFKDRELGLPYETEPQVLLHEELIPTFRVQYPGGSRTQNNFAEIRARADEILDAEIQRFKVDRPASRRYAGLIAVNPDGAIQQVTWSFGARRPATTLVARNQEIPDETITYQERRRIERLKFRTSYREETEKIRQRRIAREARRGS